MILKSKGPWTIVKKQNKTNQRRKVLRHHPFKPLQTGNPLQIFQAYDEHGIGGGQASYHIYQWYSPPPHPSSSAWAKLNISTTRAPSMIKPVKLILSNRESLAAVRALIFIPSTFMKIISSWQGQEPVSALSERHRKHLYRPSSSRKIWSFDMW
jgi:hypothetical protein